MKRNKYSKRKVAISRAKRTAGRDKQSLHKEIYFEINAIPGCIAYLAGSFNNWQPQELKQESDSGRYSTIVALTPGRYEYKFIIDNNWCHDSANPATVANEHGTLNSVITV